MTNQKAPPVDDLFYDGLVESYLDTPGFVERPWLEQQVKEKLVEPGCRFLLLTAEPGAGKTTFLAWLADRNPEWPRYFIRRDSKAPLSSGDARSFLFAIGHQLATRRPTLFRPDKLQVFVEQKIGDLKAGGRAVGIQIEDLQVSPFYQTALRVEQRVRIAAGELVGISIKHLTMQPRLRETGNLQFLALIDPAKALLAENPASRIIILVNALDELRYLPSGESILDWLAGCPELPENVRVVLTSRPDPTLLDGFRQGQAEWLRELSIHPENPNVQADLRRSARRLISLDKVGGALAKANIPSQIFMDKVVGISRGNFQCLVTLFRNLEQAVEHGDQANVQQALALEGLPESLEELYAFYVRQMRRTVLETSFEARGEGPLDIVYLPAWESLYQPIMGMLSVAREPLGQAQLLALSRLKVERRWVTGAIGRLGQFLQWRGDGFRLYHNTFVDFLTADQTATAYPDCYLDPREWHRRIVGYYLAGYEKDWLECDSYGLTNLVDHVVGASLESAERADILDRILTEGFIDAILERAGWLFSFVEDLEVLARVEPGRAAQLCMGLILDRPPNSLVIQRCLRLLVKQRAESESAVTPANARQRAVDRIVEILSTSPYKAPDTLVALLEDQTDSRVRGTIALALAETGEKSVTPRLLKMLREERREASWGAADGLIALNDRSIINELIEWYQRVESKNDRKTVADKERIIYILGWMRAEEAQTLKQSAWHARSSKIVGRGVDLTWLLRPAEGDTAFLLQSLERIVVSLPQEPAELGPWRDEWVQKRLVRALTGLGITAALPDLRRLQEHIPLRSAHTNTINAAKRDRLVEAVNIAIADLEARS